MRQKLATLLGALILLADPRLALVDGQMRMATSEPLQLERGRLVEIEDTLEGNVDDGQSHGFSPMERPIFYVIDSMHPSGQVMPTMRPGCTRVSLPDNVPVVLNVMGQVMLLHRSEPGLLEILTRLLLAPHRAQPFAPLSQRHGHAVQA